MERQFKRQQLTAGAIVKIPLENGYHTYARILMAFYDIYTKKEIPINGIIEKNILFITCVYNYTITKGYWLKIGKKLPLEDNLINTLVKYTQDALNPSRYELIYSKKTVPTTKEEIQGLEYWAVWPPEAMEMRLINHFTGKSNIEVEKIMKGEVYN